MSGCAAGRGFERLITFADAVVAIALTLLVLPLVEIPAELGDRTASARPTVFTEHRGQIGARRSAAAGSPRLAAFTIVLRRHAVPLYRAVRPLGLAVCGAAPGC